MPSGEWIQWLDIDVQMRTRMELDRRGNVVDFTVQVEVMIGDWLPVIRYDSAHGEAHIDYVDPWGVTYHKVWLDIRSPFNIPLSRAQAELRLSYRSHVERFRRQLEEL